MSAPTRSHPKSPAKVVSLQAVRDLRQSQHAEPAYRAQIASMDKLALLEEMVRFQEERSRVGSLTPQMMVRGKILFAALEQTAETRELRTLTRTYRRHLEFELESYLEHRSQSAT